MGTQEQDSSGAAGRKGVELPFFKLWPRDFLASSHVAAMGPAEVGAYCLLLMHEWLSGPLPDDPARLARMVRMPTAEFEHYWDGALGECFIRGPEGLVNARLEQERDEAMGRKAALSEAGARGARSRWGGHSQANGNPNGPSMAVQIADSREQRAETEAEPENPPTPRRGKARKRAVAFDPERFLLDEYPEFSQALPAWLEWAKDRKDRRKPLTALAARKQLKRARDEKWGPADFRKAVDASIERGWTGLFLPEDGKRNGTPAFNGFEKTKGQLEHEAEQRRLREEYAKRQGGQA